MSLGLNQIHKLSECNNGLIIIVVVIVMLSSPLLPDSCARIIEFPCVPEAFHQCQRPVLPFFFWNSRSVLLLAKPLHT